MLDKTNSTTDFNQSLSRLVALLLASLAHHKGIEVALFESNEINEVNLDFPASKYPDEPLIFIVNTLHVVGVILTWGREKLFSYAIYSSPADREILELRDVSQIIQKGRAREGVVVAYRLPEEARKILLETLGSIIQVVNSILSAMTSGDLVIHLSEELVKHISRIMTVAGVSSELEVVTIDKHSKIAYMKVAGDYDAGDMLIPPLYMFLILSSAGVKLDRLIAEIRDKKQVSLTTGRVEKTVFEFSKEFRCSLQTALYVGMFSGLILKGISLAKERGGYTLDILYDTPARAIEPEFVAIKIKRFLGCLDSAKYRVRLHIIQKVGGLIRNLTAEA